MEVDFKKESHGNFDRYTFDIPHEAIERVNIPAEEFALLIRLNESELAYKVAAAVGILAKLIEEGKYS